MMGTLKYKPNNCHCKYAWATCGAIAHSLDDGGQVHDLAQQVGDVGQGHNARPAAQQPLQISQG